MISRVSRPYLPCITSFFCSGLQAYRLQSSTVATIDPRGACMDISVQMFGTMLLPLCIMALGDESNTMPPRGLMPIWCRRARRRHRHVVRLELRLRRQPGAGPRTAHLHRVRRLGPPSLHVSHRLTVAETITRVYERTSRFDGY